MITSRKASLPGRSLDDVTKGMAELDTDEVAVV